MYFKKTLLLSALLAVFLSGCVSYHREDENKMEPTKVTKSESSSMRHESTDSSVAPDTSVERKSESSHSTTIETNP